MIFSKYLLVFLITSFMEKRMRGIINLDTLTDEKAFLQRKYIYQI